MRKIVTRIAPSPTGEMHIGSVRTALFNYLYAKQHGGTYIVRVEDTDKQRYKKEWVDAIWRDFEWCGLVPDEKYLQSEHVDRHRDLLKGLVSSGKAYISKEPKKDDPSQMVEVVRLKNPGMQLTFNDLLRGDVTFDTTELGDFVIARSIDDPLYHFAVVADDGDEGVTHVIRGDDHISNTPRQILILEALGYERPVYAHLPLILAPDKAKLSKRKHGATIEKYRQEGFIAPAVINYLALLGWNPGTEQELFSMDELIASFDLTKVHTAGAVFDIEKMRWFNRQYLMMLDDATFTDTAQSRLRSVQEVRPAGYDPFVAGKLTPILRERVNLWSDIDAQAAAGEYDFYFTRPTLESAKIPDKKSVHEDAERHLGYVAGILSEMPEEFSADELKARLWPYAEAEGRGAVLWPLRYSLSGKDRSPDPFTLASILGKTETLSRIESARVVLRGV